MIGVTDMDAGIDVGGESWGIRGEEDRDGEARGEVAEDSLTTLTVCATRLYAWVRARQAVDIA